MITKFIRFLKEKNVYNTIFQQTKHGKNYIKRIKSKQPRAYVLSAFYFDETIEGSKFWFDIHHQWLKIITVEKIIKHENNR